MNTSHTVQAVFTTGNPVFPTLTVLNSPGGQIYPFPGTYLSSVVGRSTWLFAHPDPGYKFNYFLIDGNIRPAQLYEDGEYKSSLSLSTDHTVQAIFTPS